MGSRDRCRHVTQKGETRDPNTLRVQYLKTAGDAILATIANYTTWYLVCCDAVRSAILATAWLLVQFSSAFRFRVAGIAETR